MKKFVCELCDSTDIVKQGGVFVCQSCGCKYSLEEMKKMMVEVPVEEEEKEDEGAAPVYLAPEVDKHLANARRAKQKEDWEGTEKYYALVEQNDPDSIEAIFYSAFGKAMASLTEDDIYKRQATFNVLSNSLLLLIEKYHSDRIEENRAVMIRIADDICKLINSSFVYTKWKNAYGDVVKTNQVDTYRLFGEIVGHYRVAAIRIAEIDDHPSIHEASIRVYQSVTNLKAADSNLKAMMKGYIAEEKSLLEQIIRKQKFEYWNAHPDEKNGLGIEYQSLLEQIKALQQKFEALDYDRENVPAQGELNQVRKEIDALNQQKQSLGLFNGKEKKELQRKIDALKENEAQLDKQVLPQRFAVIGQMKLVAKDMVVLVERVKIIEDKLGIEKTASVLTEEIDEICWWANEQFE